MNRSQEKVTIKGMENTACTYTETEGLLDFFRPAVRRLASTFARKAWYDLGDCLTCQKNGTGHFTLVLECQKVHGKKRWWGYFAEKLSANQNSQKRLTVMATLGES